MEDTFYNLYLGKIKKIPEDNKGEKFDVLFCLEEDKEISSELEINPNMKYFFIILQKTKTDLENAKMNVKLEWKSFSDSILELEHITSNLREIKKEFRKLLIECGTETIVFKSQAVGFNEKSEVESNEARKLILGVSTKSKWNLWN